MKARFVGLCALTFACAWLGAPHAQANDAAAAEALFSKGKQLMADGKIDEACIAFEESMRLDPGVGTKYQLGACRQEQGRNASAWSAYMEAASLAKAAGQTERAEAARKEADALKPGLSTLTVQVPEDAPEDLKVTIRDTEYGRATFATAIPFDPGSHAVTASATGFQAWKGSVTVPGDAGSVTLAIPTLVAKPEEVPVPMPGAAADSGPGALFWVGLSGLVVGAGAMVGGAVSIGTEIADENAALADARQEACEFIPCTVEEEKLAGDIVADQGEDASFALGSLLLGGGAVLAGAGAVFMILDAGGSDDNAPNTGIMVQPLIGPGFVGVRGQF